jgi:glycosyltransferase involved in cell wall biosynthesis
MAVSSGFSHQAMRVHVQDRVVVHEPSRATIAMGAPAMSGRSTAHVAILMAVYNGEKWLPNQIESIENQTHTNWFLHASDDGLHEETTDVLLGSQKWLEHKFGSKRMSLVQGPRSGFALNFLSLVCDPAIDGEYFAFCDQDDVWDANKLERALAWLETVDPEVPALYCGRTRLIDAHGLWWGDSPLFAKAPGFRNALVQSIAGGNTMVFNAAARRLLQSAGAVGVVTHDWWVYLAVSACGGVVKYDPAPTLSYRQHEHNIVGQNTSWTARIKRIVMLFRGDFRNWTDRNLVALERLGSLITPEARADLDRFKAARTSSFPARLALYRRCRLYRQTFFGTLGLIVAGWLNKL